MGGPTSVTTENQEPRRKGGPSCSKETPAVIDDIEVAYSDEERASQGPWPSEVPPTGLLAGMLGEMTFYYGACWRHYRSTRR